MKEELQNEVDSMLEMEIVRPSTSPHPSSWFRKKMVLTGCVLTLEVKQEVDPEPTAEDLFRRLSGMKYLSKIDLTKGYWQIPVAPEDVYKTAFVTPDGQCEFFTDAIWDGKLRSLSED